jgi:hypothetical protein
VPPPAGRRVPEETLGRNRGRPFEVAGR